MFDLLPAFGHLNPRLAAFLMVALLVAAAIPLALGWWKVLPPEREPFARPDLPRQKNRRDLFPLFLLLNVSLSLIAAIPRIAETLHLASLVSLLPPACLDRITLIFFIWLVVLPAFAAAYSAVRPNPIRPHLILAGILVLVLWLLSPTLLASLASRP